MKHIAILSLILFNSASRAFAQHLDTSAYAILRFEAHYGFPEQSISATLNQDELLQIEKMIVQIIQDHNKKNKHYTIDISKYKRQYIAALTPTGEKIVWVNCFCDSLGTDWHKEMLIVEDVGKCFFNLILNLKKNNFYNFFINGIG